MVLCNIIGTRPQVIKYSALYREIQKRGISNITIDTGQHYDYNMSAIFYDEFSLPQPKYNLNIKSGSHGWQTGKMLTDIEKVLIKKKPSTVIVYGDTNSTLAGALAAVKLHIPVVHIEAGVRSFNRNMPEEINRVMTDHVSSMLFAPTQTAMVNLLKEGITSYLSGDLMYDNALFYGDRIKLECPSFVLLTIHRDFNTDNPERLKSIITTLNKLSKCIEIIFPAHPRTLKALKDNSLELSKGFRLVKPFSYLAMLVHEKSCKFIITDSGGVQKESHFFKKPCIVLRKETEWPELVNNGTSFLVDADKQKLEETFLSLLSDHKFNYPEFFGNGKAAEFILDLVLTKSVSL